MNKISTLPRTQNTKKLLGGALWLLSFFIMFSSANAQTKLVSWDVSGVTNYGVSPFAPTTTNANLENIVGFTRGAGLSAGTGGVTGGWGATNWADTQANAIANDDVIYFGFKPKAGFALSLSTIDPFSYRRSGTGPEEGRLQYTVNGGTSYSGISQGPFFFGNSSSGGASVNPAISIISDADLQQTSNTVGFKIVPFGATNPAGTFYIFDVNTSGDDFSVNGSILGTTETALALAACKDIAGTAKTFTVKGDGLTSGNITIDAPADFEISLDGITYSPSLTLTPVSGSVDQQYSVRLKSGLTAGSYTGNVTVLGGGFTTTANLGVALTGTVHALPTAVVNSVSPICIGDAFPSVNIDLTGAALWTLTYSDGTSSTEETGVASTIFSVQSTADGEVFTATALTDANGCVALVGDLTGSATVVVNSLPEVSVVATNGASSGTAGVYNQGETVSITATVDVGAGAYSWTGPDGFTAGDLATITVASATSAKAGTYTVTATDANLCAGTAGVEVVVYDNTIYVATTGDDTNTGSAASPLKTIQKAIDVAVATNTIEVDAGTYTENVVINVSNITLNGTNAGINPNTGTRSAETIISGRLSIGTPSATLNEYKDITVDGFTIDAPVGPAETVWAEGAGNNLTFSNNIVVAEATKTFGMVTGTQNPAQTYKRTGWNILNNTFNGPDAVNSTALNLWVLDDLNIAGNHINDCGRGIQLLWISNVDVTDNVITDTRAQGILVASTVAHPTVSAYEITSNVNVTRNSIDNAGTDNGRGGVYIASGNLVNVNVSNNTMQNSDKGVHVTPGPIDWTNVSINENDFSSCTFGVYNEATGSIDATCNWFGVTSAQDVATKVSGDVAFLPFGTNGTDDDLVTLGFQPVAGSCDGNGPVKLYTDNTLTSLTNSYFTIQGAIDAASSGNAIVADAGTYTENVAVNKEVTINGANAGVACNGSRSAESIVSVTSGIPFNITADNVTINGFDITAPASRNAVVIGNVSDATVNFNKIHDIGTTYTGGNVHAIVHIVPNSPVANLTISDNCINDISSTLLTNYSSSAIGILQSTSSGILTGLDIERNIIDNVTVNDGNWPTGKIAYGVQINVGGGSSYLTNTGKVLNAKVNNNEISNLSGHIATGIGLEGNTEDAMVKNNSVANLTSTKSADRAGGGFDLNGLKFENNRFVSSVTVENNSFATSTFTNNGTANLGYAVVNYVPSSTATLSCNWFGTAISNDIADKVDLTGKLLSKATAAIAFEPYLTSDGDGAGIGFQPTGDCNGSTITIASITPTAATCTVNGSFDITFSGGNAPFDISYTDGGVNTGSASGVSSPRNFNGLAAAIYTVTITDANGSTASQSVTIDYLPVTNVTTSMSYATIQAAIDAATANDVIEVCDGSYTETLTVNKALTINGANVGIAGTATRTDESVLLNSKVTISGSGPIVFDGFKFLRDDAVAGDVILVGNTTTTITNNIFERNGSVTGIGIRAVVTAAGSAVKTISNNLFTGDGISLFSGHKTWNNAVYVNGATGTVNIQNNTFENNRTALNIDDHQAGIVVDGNTFTNNGTHIAFGGTTPTTGSFTLGANDFQLSGSAIMNLSNVADEFRVDVTSSTYKGTALASTTDADLFEFEAQLFHKGRSSRKGKVVYKANNQFVNNFTTPFTKIDVIQNSVLYADANDIINLQAGTYNQRVVIDKSDVTLQGVDADETLYLIDGSAVVSGNGDGIQIASGAKNVTVKQLTIQNFSGANGNSDAGIYAVGGNDGLEVDDVVIKDNVGGSGIYANGPVDGVTITNSKVEGQTSSARGIVIWNGFKQNITITGNTLSNNNCCGIELQDGTASAVNISNNIIDIGIGDNAIGLTSLNELTGANLIDNNTITGGGRYGIEVKNPAGGVTVSNNNVTLTTQNADLRDRAGIAIFRRGFIAGQGYANIPNGVTVTGNTVTGYQQTSDSEGFGIVIEGTNHIVSNNTLENNDIGIQQQAGHSPYTADASGDGDQSNLADLYFGRGNSPEICNVTLSGNTYTTNGVDERIVVGGGAGTIVTEVTPTVSDPVDIEVCNGGTIAATTFSGNNLSGVVYNWTNDNVNVGLAASGTGDIASFTAVNATNAVVSATITVTPTVNGCDGTPQEFTTIINPTPVATITGDATLCMDAAEPQVTFTGTAGVEPYTFMYTIDGGLPQTIATTSGNTVTLNVPTATAGTFVYALTDVSSANGCSVAITGQAATIIVNDKAVVTAGTYTAICQGGNVTLSGSFSGGASAITWSDGAAGGSFAPNANDPAATYTPPANFTGTVTLTITSDDPTGPCPVAIATATLIVNPTPTVAITPVTPFCGGGMLSLSASVTGATSYAWSGPGGYTSTDASPTIPNATAAASGVYTLIVTSADLCTATATTTVTVYRRPEAPVITSDNSEICKGTNAVLSASCATSTDVFRWITPPVNQGTSSLSNTGTQVVNAPGTYVGYCESVNGCVGPNGSITITEGTNCNGGNFIVVSPELPFICPGASVQLTASGCSTGTVSWITASGTVTGATVTLTPAATTTYLVTCSTGGSTTINVRVAQPNVVVTNNISTGRDVVKAVNTIESAKRVGDPNVTPAPNVIYEAGNSIMLKPGFVAQGQAVFKAEIKVCN
jgi:hypothetical protein